MRDSWVGLQAGVDAHKWARLLRRAHESAVNGGHVPAIVREVIANSWERCSETRPYRLIDIDADLEALRRRLGGGRSSAALHDDPGPLLPGSTVPAIVAARQWLTSAIRESTGRPHLA